MNMRKQFVKTVEQLLPCDEKLVLLLGDIGVFGFRRAFEEFSKRVFNIGILEPATISLASGLAKTGLVPIVHTIAPFIAERSFEQLKIDFGYQRLGGNFVSVGASYDYASLGCTHHCPGDVGVLLNIPGMEIIVPGTSTEFDMLFRQAYSNGHPTYYRLSERDNPESQNVTFGKANVLQSGDSATVIAVGPVLNHVLPAVEGRDVGLLYYSTVEPFDYESLRENLAASGKVLIVEPFYSGTLTYKILQAIRPRPIVIDFIGVPHEFLTNYGHVEEHDEHLGLSCENIRAKLEALING
jgi:transketolase